ncbi:MAG: NAD-dependent epimerase/dehydratase family protein [Planctomycetota bacterium]
MILPQMDNSRRALVTGGLGFVGSHVAAELLKRDYDITILDDGSNANPDAVAEYNNHPRVRIVNGSTLDIDALAGAARGCGQIYHLAAIVGVRRVAGNPRGVLDAHVESAHNVVHICKERRLPLLYVSSSEVYGSAESRGSNSARAFHESDAPGFDRTRIATDGRAAYAYSKWLGEQAVAQLAEAGIPAVVVRPFNMIGAGQSFESGSLVPSLILQALTTFEMRLESDGGATRAWLPVRDAARAFVELMHCGSAQGRIINVGGTRVLSILQIAELLKEILGFEASIHLHQKTTPAGMVTIRDRRPDLARFYECLGWRPESPVSGALEEAVQFARRSSIICAGAAAI